MKIKAISLVFGLIGAMTLAGAGGAVADSASILDAVATANIGGSYSITVVASHRDEGWKHYLDRWDVLGPDGKVIASRTLYHPHVDEQPFQRSLSPVNVPVGVTEVTVRAHCSRDGDGTRVFKLQLPRR